MKKYGGNLKQNSLIFDENQDTINKLAQGVLSLTDAIYVYQPSAGANQQHSKTTLNALIAFIASLTRVYGSVVHTSGTLTKTIVHNLDTWAPQISVCDITGTVYNNPDIITIVDNNTITIKIIAAVASTYYYNIYK